MKLLKKILLYSFLFQYSPLYLQQPVTLEETIPAMPVNSIMLPEEVQNQPTLMTEEIVETTPSVAEAQKDVKKEKGELSLWNSHLQSLLVKGAHWDVATSAPTSEWTDTALDRALGILQQDVFLADELKSSFLQTINNKYSIIEEGKNLQEIVFTIKNFNDSIDKIVEELTPKEEKQNDIQNNGDKEKNATEGQVQEPIFSASEEKITEEPATESAPESEEDKEARKQQERQSEWQKHLEYIKTEGKNTKEVAGIMEDTIEIAKELIVSFASEEQENKITQLKSEFEGALKERPGNLEPFPSGAQETFDKAISALLKNETQPQVDDYFSSPPTTYSEPLQKTPNYKQTPKQSQMPLRPQQPKAPQLLPEKTMTEPVVQKDKKTPSYQVFAPAVSTNDQAAFDASAKQKALAKMKQNQEKLAQRIQIAAEKKAAQEKAEAEKGIGSSIMEGVFGSWWTGTANEQEEKIALAQEDKVIKEITEKFDKQTQDNIKLAYQLFQKNLFLFDEKNFWDVKTDLPTQEFSKWLEKVTVPLKILMKYEILDKEGIIDIVQKALKNKKVTVEHYLAFIKKITLILDEYNKQLEQEKAEKLQQKQTEEERQKEEDIKREAREKERALFEEQQKMEAAKKQENRRKEALKKLPLLENEWKELIKKIEQSVPKSQEVSLDHAQYLKQAVTIAEEILARLTLLQQNKKQKIAQYKADFANALIKQQTHYRNMYNGQDINVSNVYTEFYNIINGLD